MLRPDPDAPKVATLLGMVFKEVDGERGTVEFQGKPEFTNPIGNI